MSTYSTAPRLPVTIACAKDILYCTLNCTLNCMLFVAVVGVSIAAFELHPNNNTFCSLLELGGNVANPPPSITLYCNYNNLRTNPYRIQSNYNIVLFSP